MWYRKFAKHEEKQGITSAFSAAFGVSKGQSIWLLGQLFEYLVALFQQRTATYPKQQPLNRSSTTLRERTFALNMLGRFRGKQGADTQTGVQEQDIGVSNDTEKPAQHMHIPRFNHNGHRVTRGIKPDGESGRAGIHPWHFIRICFRSTSHMSMCVNVLWPFVPPAIALHFARPDLNLWIFVLNYIAMVPSANLIGFAGQELARKLPKVFGKSSILNTA